jgi:hypothetical protein
MTEVYTIETTFDLPIYRQRTYSAPSVEAACRMALADDEWKGSHEDVESCGPHHITGAWAGADTAYEPGADVPIPPAFREPDQGSAPLLAELLREAVGAWAEQFDGPQDVDLNISGSDLLEWFSEWRIRAKAALAAAAAPELGQ